MNLFSTLFRRSEKRAHADLMHLDDRMLRDIGLSRADVHRLMTGVRTAHIRPRRTDL